MKKTIVEKERQVRQERISNDYFAKDLVHFHEDFQHCYLSAKPFVFTNST
jgi:tRNA 2-selenouridine synthase SelU